MISFLAYGCATKTYYACRSGGGTREYCSGYADAPVGGVLPPQGPVLAGDSSAQPTVAGP